MRKKEKRTECHVWHILRSCRRWTFFVALMFSHVTKKLKKLKMCNIYMLLSICISLLIWLLLYCISQRCVLLYSWVIDQWNDRNRKNFKQSSMRRLHSPQHWPWLNAQLVGNQANLWFLCCNDVDSMVNGWLWWWMRLLLLLVVAAAAAEKERFKLLGWSGETVIAVISKSSRMWQTSLQGYTVYYWLIMYFYMHLIIYT